MIVIEEVDKSYGDLQVLRGLSLRVAEGEVYGLLGPNGVGKSTLIHLMLGFLRPDAGRVQVLDSRNLERVRSRIGYVPERQRYHTRYTAREYLRFIGRFSGMPADTLNERVDLELRTVGLADAADRRLMHFSKGMLQRLGIAQALLTDPDLLLIDEPTSGLDPAGQREVIDLLASVRDRHHTIFLCTHYLQEVELLCDRVGVLARGQIVAEASVRSLETSGASVLIRTSPLVLEVRQRIEALGPMIRAESSAVRIRSNTPALQEAVLRALLDSGALVFALEPLERPLERLYLDAVRGESGAEVFPATVAQPARPDESPNGSIALPWAPPTTPPAPPSARTGEGDTLLNELLGRKRDDDDTPKTPEQ
ncbi:MAG: ABC transporter ATP-binding protein [Oscillochloris sp.]|nr:ABC transporter ATP-binding protein [Oscillochloris sp.]